jgi:protein SCO1/2
MPIIRPFPFNPGRRAGLLTAGGLLLTAMAARAAVAQSGREPGEFDLIDMQGKPARLADHRGKWVLVLFGFTHCPDICPTMLISVGQVMAAMGAEARRLQPLFITVDPERDTPAVLKEYVANFDGGVIGLTGTPAQIATVAESYGVVYRKREMPGAPYQVEHSTASYLMTPAGKFSGVYWLDRDPDPAKLAGRLVAAMREHGS